MQGKEAARAAFMSPTGQLDEQQRQRFGQLYGGQLQSQLNQLNPQQFTNPVQMQAQQLGQMAEASRTAPGRFGLLRQTIGRPGEQYSVGQQRLDDLFLQGTRSAGELSQNLRNLAQTSQQQVGETAQEFQSRLQGLSGLLGEKRTAAENLLLRGETEDFRNEQFGGGLEDIQAGLQQRLTDLRGAAPGQYEQLRSALAQNVAPGINNPIMQQLQDIVGQGSIYNLDLASYLTSPEAVQGRLAEATPEQLATEQEFNRFQQLSSLLGREGMGITEAQQFNPFELDSERLRSDLDTRSQQIEATKRNEQAVSDNILRAFVDVPSFAVNGWMPPEQRAFRDALRSYFNDDSQANLSNLLTRAQASAGYGGYNVWDANFGVDPSRSTGYNLWNQRNQALGLDTVTPQQMQQLYNQLREKQAINPYRQLFSGGGLPQVK